MVMVYQWKDNSRFPVGAQIAAERLQQIKTTAGEISPRTVVDDARSHNSPLHRCFEWDDEKAAEAHRLQQARMLIGAIVVVSIDDQPVNRETRAFVHVTVDASPRYEDVQVAMQRPDMREEVLARAQDELMRWRARYDAYVEFASIVSEIDKVFAEQRSAKRAGKARRALAA